MPNLKKINLLGHLTPKVDSADDAVLRFINLLRDRVAADSTSGSAFLLSAILQAAGNHLSRGFPSFRPSVMTDFFDFLVTLKSELNPSDPYDEKFDQLTAQIPDTVNYLISGLEGIADQEILNELHRFAGIPVQSSQVTTHAENRHPSVPGQPLPAVPDQLSMPPGMLEQLFEEGKRQETVAPVAQVQEIVSAKPASTLQTVPASLDFGFNLADLFGAPAQPTEETGAVITPVGQLVADVDSNLLSGLVSEPELTEDVTAETGAILFEEPESDIVAIDSPLETMVEEEIDVVLTDDLAEPIEEIQEVVSLTDEDLTTSVADISPSPEEIHLVEDSGPVLEETSTDLIEEAVEDVQEMVTEETFESTLGQTDSFDLSEISDESASEVFEEQELAEEVSEELAGFPEESPVAETPEPDSFPDFAEVPETEPFIADNMKWMVAEIRKQWDAVSAGDPNFEIITMGLDELMNTSDPIASFRNVSSLPEYNEFVDFLEAVRDNPSFDRSLVASELPVIADRAFQLFNDILLLQTRPDLGELSEGLTDAQLADHDRPEVTGLDEETPIEEEPIISESVLEDGVSLLEGEAVTQEDLIPETEEPGNREETVLAEPGLEPIDETAGHDFKLDENAFADHVIQTPDQTMLSVPAPTEPVYFQVIQDVYSDIRKLNSIGSNRLMINQFVDFSRSLKDPVELLREHTNVEFVREFIEFIDGLHARYDSGDQSAYNDLATHRMQIADKLYDMLLEHPEITGEEPEISDQLPQESPLHLVHDSGELVEGSLDLIDELSHTHDELSQDLAKKEESTTVPGEETGLQELSEIESSDLTDSSLSGTDETVIADELAGEGLIEEEVPVSEDVESPVIEEEFPAEEATVPDTIEDVLSEDLIQEEAISDLDLPQEVQAGDLPAEGIVSDELSVEEALTEEPVIDDTAVEEPLAEEPLEEEPLAEEPLAEEPLEEELLAEEPLLEEGLAEEPIPEEPLVDDLAELTSLPDEPAEVAPAAPAPRQKQVLNEIQQVFLLEAEENIQKISDDLLVLEKDLGNVSIIDGILRSAHTLKGSAAMMKFTNMSKLGHKMEDVFQILRDEKLSADRDLIDIMLKGTDLQTLMLKSLREDGHDEVPGLPEAIHHLEQYLKKLEAKQEGKAFVAEKYEAPAAETTPAIAPKTVPEPVGDTSRAPSQQDQRKGIVAEQTLRINITTLNSLINLAAELLISRNRMNNQLGFMEGILLKLQKEKILLNSIMKKVQNFAGKTEGGSGYTSSEEPGILQDFAETEFDRFSEVDIILRDMRSNLSNFEDLSSEIRLFGDAFRQSILSVSSIANELNIEIMSMRMVPVKHMFIRFQRSIRDIGREESKDVDLKIEGEDTRLDKTVMEEVIEPIMHCVRNAVSHGIELPETRKKRGKSETGLITLRAYQDGNQVVLEVEDDGNGIDAARLKSSAVNKRIISPERAEQMTDTEAMELMFVAGFSTAEKVTSLSGRGVGMDVVKNVVNKFKGTIAVKSTLGKGSCFTIRLPLTLAINQSLLIQVGGRTYAFPLNTVEETVELHMENIQRIGDQELITVRNETIPLIHLATVLGMEEDPSQMRAKYPVVILSEAEQKIAIRVDRLIGKEEIVVKNLGSHLKNVMGVTGATVLGDGSVILILDVAYLFRYWQGGSSPSYSPVRADLHRLPGGDGGNVEAEEPTTPAVPDQPKTRIRGKIRVLCADDSVSIRKYVESLLKREEFEVITAPDGAEAFDMAERSRFDLIMTDLEMPKMHGYELISAIRSKPNLVNIPIVILTARSGEKHRRRGLELGANAFLNKPFDVDELLSTIYSLLPR
ncbi:MAG: chemotaxis protein CheW [Bacteroidetes bacterium]|nr:chemotaxis protein CheW [Bacteroidota bacterium]